MATEEGFRIVRPPRAQPSEPTTYINGVAVTVSPWDFCLMFSRAIPTDPLVNDPQAQVGEGRREVAMQGEVVQRIVMSPEHAKAMAAQLTQNVVLFESEFGPIPQPQPEPEPEPVARPKAQRKARARRK